MQEKQWIHVYKTETDWDIENISIFYFISVTKITIFNLSE